MSHYKSNVRDLTFNLFELLGLGAVLDGERYAGLDEATVRTMLRDAALLSEGPVAASFSAGDRTPLRFDAEDAVVHLPKELADSTRAWRDAGWTLLGVSEAVGGVPAPRMVVHGVNELVLGANPAAAMYAAGEGFADILFKLGNEEQQGWAGLAVERGWGATMVLTEPDAGSDVGAGRATAKEQPDGSWHIEGVKRFITAGDSGDLFENIVHLVLARPEGAGPGTKGLSLFCVPKFHFDAETGEPGARNGVYVSNVEKKMGLKGSATCELTFGANGTPAQGWLVGDVHDGIRQMFLVIEHARMLVGTKAISTLSTAYLNALDYAKTRIQGADLAAFADRSAPRVSILHHPDVRRSLMLQKAYAEGLRATYLFTASHQDEDVAKELHGIEPDLARRVNDLLLPIVKGVGSERTYEMLTHALQTFGGSGYLQDYPLEQYIRDAKIDSLYEGTTAIQAQDFFFRKIVRDQGAALGHVTGLIQRFIDDDAAGLSEEGALLATALADVQAMLGSMTSHLMAAQDEPTRIYRVGLASVELLLAFGDLVIGWLLLRQSQVASAALQAGASGSDLDFYAGKVAVAAFFARTQLPRLAASRAVIEGIDGAIMELSEGAF
jgi:alkylation response protein AidB-like acyl-CoA dehydrogenase